MLTKTKNILGVVSLGLVLAAPAGAWGAGASIKSYEIEPVDKVPPPAKPEDPQRYPRLWLKVGTSATGLKASDFQIKAVDVEPVVALSGAKVTPFKDSDEDLNVVILVQGSVRFMGNPNPEPLPGEENQEIPGYYEQVKQAIDAIAKARQKKTQVALYVYGDKAIERVPLGPASNLSGESLGAQKDYSRITTKAFKVSLAVVHTLLSNVPGRRVLFVIGDGEDQNDNANINDEIKKLEDSSVEVYVLGANPRGTLDAKASNRLTKLGKLGEYALASQAEQIPQLAEALANNMNNVYTVEFPGMNPQDGSHLPFDGKEHDIVVSAKKEETEPKTILLPNYVPPEPKVDDGGSMAWLWVLLGVLGLGALGVVAFVLLRKGNEEDEVEEEAPPPPPIMAMPAPPPPAAPAKTMMLGIGGSEDAMPVVGWIVPLTGSNQFQTFKLSSRTVVGTAAECQVAVQDQFMSGQHCEILMSNNGFTIMDKGSSNGVLVNSKRVAQHELVDNDVFICGKTEFKFKSIN
jgi:hypothetical protein